MLQKSTHIKYNGSTNLNFEIKDFNGDEDEFIKNVTSEIIEKLSSMIDKSLNVLIPFTMQIFENEYLDNKGYFELGDIEVSDVTEYSAFSGLHYTLSFSLESEKSIVMDYCTYFVMFDSRFTLTSIYRM